MACGCIRVSHLLVSPYKPCSSVQPTRRVLLKPSPLRSTLKRRAGQHGTTITLPLGGARCSYSPPLGSSSSDSSMEESPSGSSSSSKLNRQGEDSVEAQPGRVPIWRVKLAAGCLLAFVLSYGVNTKAAFAVAENSIATSSLGIKVATFLRSSGWSAELIVFTVAMLPVLELRGAIPISYWLGVVPLKGYILAVVGNMVPVPFILLYLPRLSSFLGERSPTAKNFLNWLFESSRKKGGVIDEFGWLGLALFVAVPFPGTGAWTGAIIAAILGMPLWDAMTANFFGVVLAGVLVSIVVTVGAKTAVLVGAALFAVSSFMWSLLRLTQKKKDATSFSSQEH